MKKILFVLFITITIQTSFAQITISDGDGNPYINGATYNLPLEANYEGIPFIVTNTSASPITILIEVSQWANANGIIQVCGNGNCVELGSYSGTPKSIGNAPQTLDPNASTTGEDTHIQCLGVPALGDYLTIKVYEQGNESNSSTFTLDTQTSGISHNTETKLISIYPNPATNFLTVNIANELLNSKIIISDLLGKIVLSETINSSNKTFLTNNYSKGIYFYSIVNNNNIVETKKIIIK